MNDCWRRLNGIEGGHGPIHLSQRENVKVREGYI